MASITILLKKNKQKPNRTYPIYIRITQNRKSKFIYLNIDVPEDLWDERNHKVKSKFPNATRVNLKIASELAKAQASVLELESNNKNVSSQLIKDSLVGKKSSSFIEYLDTYLDKLDKSGKAGTHDKVSATSKKLKTYLKNSDLSFREFDLDFLKQYEKYLRDQLKNTQNTINSNLKIFRKLFNDAELEGIIEIQHNPFHKFKLAWDNTEKCFLTEAEITKLSEINVKKGTKQELHLDLFIFACYAGGIRIADLLKLNNQNFDGVSIKLFTQKTKKQVSIKLPDKAIAIIKKYWNEKAIKKSFIFPALMDDRDYDDPKVLRQTISSVTAHINKNLKIFGKLAKIENPIHFHQSRHSFAYMALDKGMPLANLSKLMTHNSIKTTQIYTHLIDKQLDDSMDLFN
jgi:site-specific recombinase XerD